MSIGFFGVLVASVIGTAALVCGINWFLAFGAGIAVQLVIYTLAEALGYTV